MHVVREASSGEQSNRFQASPTVIVMVAAPQDSGCLWHPDAQLSAFAGWAVPTHLPKNDAFQGAPKSLVTWYNVKSYAAEWT